MKKMQLISRKAVRGKVLALVTVMIAIVFFAYDLVVDAFIHEEVRTLHFAIELLVFVSISITLVIGIRDLLDLRARLSREEERVSMFSRSLAESIDTQMDDWRFTPSEREVAWLVIKGYRFAEIASARGVKENTARLQATSVYAKAGVSGRSEFVAEIIQSLLLSIPDRSLLGGRGTDTRPETL